MMPEFNVISNLTHITHNPDYIKVTSKISVRVGSRVSGLVATVIISGVAELDETEFSITQYC
jgi:hypothetical protein